MPIPPETRRHPSIFTFLLKIGCGFSDSGGLDSLCSNLISGSAMGRLCDPLLVSLEDFSQGFASFTLQAFSFTPEDNRFLSLAVSKTPEIGPPRRGSIAFLSFATHRNQSCCRAASLKNDGLRQSKLEQGSCGRLDRFAFAYKPSRSADRSPGSRTTKSGANECSRSRSTGSLAATAGT
jgi:hypothetical protein